MARTERPRRDERAEEQARREQERLDREQRQAARQAEREEKLRQRQARQRERALRPERVRNGDRPAEPRNGQIIHVVDERKYLRFNDQLDEPGWEEVERHRPCDNWIRKGDPVELNVHECVNDQTPVVVFQCERCQTKYRVARNEADAFAFRYRDCPTCGTPWTEDMPRDAIAKDFR
jgi:hypothetical protein